ncbi:type VII secretion system-associated protein [Streptomyces longisporoflavus]|uniref:Type VII secretion system-associated protein n=1 Tax=Streptomyces longisporoflavus TaxID=28044 RepID=A0ABW7QF51_9ACTN
MAGEKADVKHFDLKQMENFRDNEVQAVYNRAKTHREDGSKAGVRTLGELIDGHVTSGNLEQDQQLLRIGKMVKGTLVSGSKLVEGVTTAATALDKLLGDQIELFKELKEALTDTIDEAGKTKDKNLEAIDAKTLLQSFEDVDTLTAGGSGGSDGSDDDS